MQPIQTTPSVPAVQLPVMMVAELQDSLLVVVHDLSRLDHLLAHTMENLMERFTAVSANLADPELAQSKELDAVRSNLRAAVTAPPSHVYTHPQQSQCIQEIKEPRRWRRRFVDRSRRRA